MTEPQIPARPKAAEAVRARATLRNSPRGGGKWYEIRNADSDVAEILIYHEIGFFGVSAEQFVRELDRVTAATIHLRINCPGGDVFDGLAIHNAVKRHPANVIVFVDGMAASTASWIAMAGDEVRMATNSYLMIHNPWGVGIGEAADLRQLADLLDKLAGTIADMYASRSGRKAAEFRKLMQEETWFTADEAVDRGLADSVQGDAPADAFNRFDLTVFSKAPDRLGNINKDSEGATIKTVRDFEKFLRDAGFPRDAARKIASGGFKQAAPRDGAEPSDAESDPRDEAGLLLSMLRPHVADLKTLATEE